MKTKLLLSSVITCCTLSSIAFPNDTPSPLDGLKAQGMQAMMGNMQKIQTCMSSIDKNELMSLGEQAKKVKESIKTHCASGNKEKAEQEALSFATTLQSSKAAHQAQDCLKDIPDMMRGHLQGMEIANLDEKLKSKNICDANL